MDTHSKQYVVSSLLEIGLILILILGATLFGCDTPTIGVETREPVKTVSGAIDGGLSSGEETAHAELLDVSPHLMNGMHTDRRAGPIRP